MASEPLNGTFQKARVPGPVQTTELVNQGVADLTQIASLLAEIRHSTEVAVREIFAVMDKIEALLKEVFPAGELAEKPRQALDELRNQLPMIFNALQFQDITSQQIEAINALLAGLGEVLIHLAGNPEGLGLPQVEVREGTFDPQAVFDRGKARQSQQRIDSLLAGIAQSAGASGTEENAERGGESIP